MESAGQSRASNEHPFIAFLPRQPFHPALFLQLVGGKSCGNKSMMSDLTWSVPVGTQGQRWGCDSSATPVPSIAPVLLPQSQQEGRGCSGNVQCFPALWVMQGMGQGVLGPVQDPGEVRGLREPEDAAGFGPTSVSRGETALLLSLGFISLKSCLFALSGAGGWKVSCGCCEDLSCAWLALLCSCCQHGGAGWQGWIIPLFPQDAHGCFLVQVLESWKSQGRLVVLLE